MKTYQKGNKNDQIIKFIYFLILYSYLDNKILDKKNLVTCQSLYSHLFVTILIIL